MKWNVGTKIGAGFSVVLVIVIIVGAISYRSTTQLIDVSEARGETQELLTHLGEIRFLLTEVQAAVRGYAIVGEERYLEPYNQALGRLKPILGEVRERVRRDAEQERRFLALQPLIDARLTISKDIINSRREGGLEAGMQTLRSGKGEENMGDIRQALQEMQNGEEAVLTKRIEQAEKDAQNAQWTIFLGTLTAVAAAALVGIVITRNIARPLREIITVAERITLGDLREGLAVGNRSDEVGALAQAFNRMTQSLRTMAAAAEQIAAGDLRTSVRPQSENDVLGNAFVRMLGDLREQIRALLEGANVLGSASSQIVSSTTQLAATASEAATSVNETTTTVEEVRQTAQIASQKAKTVSESAQKAAQISLSGRKSTEDVVVGMGRIRQQMEAIATSMVGLSEQTQSIGQIIATVEDLAAQSNLLAVNAAIEAAKAGEHGKGFGVVAQEVKSLAEQSRQATTQVRTLLNDIQKATAAAMMATEQGGKAVEAGERQTGTAGESIQVLAGSVSEAAQAATQIAASSQQQLVGMDQVAVAMENIKQASSQNVASAKQLESAARNLNQLGLRIKGMVERYQL